MIRHDAHNLVRSCRFLNLPRCIVDRFQRCQCVFAERAVSVLGMVEGGEALSSQAAAAARVRSPASVSSAPLS